MSIGVKCSKILTSFWYEYTQLFMRQRFIYFKNYPIVSIVSHESFLSKQPMIITLYTTTKKIQKQVKLISYTCNGLCRVLVK